MNLILLEQNNFTDDGLAVLKGRAFVHTRDVLKLREKDIIRIGLVNGCVGSGEVVEVGLDSIVLKVVLDKEPPAKLDITLILALPRPPVFKRLLSAVTAMGVSRMIFIQTARVEKSYWNSPFLDDERVREALWLGLEQARDTMLPEVIFEQRFKPFVEDRLPLMAEGKKCLLAHPEGAQSCLANILEPMVLAVGPEGGFVDFEVEKFKKAGFLPVHLGVRPFRVETAVQALIGRVMHL